MPGINVFNQHYPAIALQLRKTISHRDVYFVRGGVQYKRRWILPPNPRTQPQQNWRGVFRQAVSAWRDLTLPQRQEYNTIAHRRSGCTGFNVFVSHYLSTYGQ